MGRNDGLSRGGVPVRFETSSIQPRANGGCSTGGRHPQGRAIEGKCEVDINLNRSRRREKISPPTKGKRIAPMVATRGLLQTPTGCFASSPGPSPTGACSRFTVADVRVASSLSKLADSAASTLANPPPGSVGKTGEGAIDSPSLWP